MTHGHYFNWLCSLACPLGGGLESLPLKTFTYLFDTPYKAQLENDESREVDGIRLRYDYSEKTGRDIPEIGQCNLLEMIIGLAFRLSGMTKDLVRDSSVSRWVTEMLINLGAIKHTLFSITELPDLPLKVTRFLNRSYERDGEGGLFPLVSTDSDQRTVELWYQANEYIIENYM